MKKNIVLIHWVDVPQQWAIDLYYYTKYLSLNQNINVKTIISNVFLWNNDSFMKDSFIEIWNNYNKWLLSSIKFIYYAFIELKKINRINKIDYVHFFSMHPMSVILQFFVKYFLRIDTIYDIISWPIWKWLVYNISYITEKIWIFLSKKYIIDHKKLINLLSISTEKKYIELWIWCEIKNNLNYENYFNKKKNEVIFMYIGSLNKDRELLNLIYTFNKLSEVKDFTYRLIIIWKWDDEQNLKRNTITKNIKFLWYQPHNKIPFYMYNSDVLISYIPKKIYFEYQPPTKLLEWLAIWKIVIATSTFAQNEILQSYNDFLFDDNYESLKNKIIYISKNINNYSENDIKKIVEDFTWEKLINEKLIPFYLK